MCQFICSNSYQKYADLGGIEKVENKERRLGNRENVPLWESRWSSNLYRSRSMDLHPQRESRGTKALCALFESKASQQQDLNSSPLLSSAAAAAGRTARERPLQDQTSPNNLSKAPTVQVSEFPSCVIKLNSTEHPVLPDFTTHCVHAMHCLILSGKKKQPEKSKSVMHVNNIT